MNKPVCNMQIMSKGGALCGVNAVWQNPRWPEGLFCTEHKNTLALQWPNEWTRIGKGGPQVRRMAVHDLEQAIQRGCDHPDCDHKDHDELFLKPRCHPGAGVSVSYKKGTGVVNVHCRTCQQHVAQIGVALV